MMDMLTGEPLQVIRIPGTGLEFPFQDSSTNYNISYRQRKGLLGLFWLENENIILSGENLRLGPS